MRRRRRELQAKIETLGEAENGESSAANDLDSRTRELKSINSSIQLLTKKAQGECRWLDHNIYFRNISFAEMEKEAEKLTSDLQENRAALETVQNQQVDDGRSIARQQKNTERYLAKKTMLVGRKDECNRNIRDLGVLPEEAFEKYTSQKLDRVSPHLFGAVSPLMFIQNPARQKASHRQRRPQEVCPCQQEGF